MRNTFKALVLSAVVFATLNPLFAAEPASTASPAAKQAISAPVEQAAPAEAVTPQVNSPVSPAAVQEALGDAPVVPDLGLFGKILLWVVAVNLLLGGLAAALAKVKDITATKADDQVYAWLTMIVGFLTKVLDFATANTRPKK